MVDSKENYKFDLGVKGSMTLFHFLYFSISFPYFEESTLNLSFFT